MIDNCSLLTKFAGSIPVLCISIKVIIFPNLILLQKFIFLASSVFTYVNLTDIIHKNENSNIGFGIGQFYFVLGTKCYSILGEGKITKGIPPLRKQKLSKHHKRKMIKLNINITLLIVIGMIVNSNYIGTSLGGLIQEVESKEKPLFKFFKEIIYSSR